LGKIVVEITEKEAILSKVKNVREKDGRLVAINGYVDGEGKNVVVYTLEYDDIREHLHIKDVNELPTITTVYNGAQWFEEEIQEMMPVKFQGLNASNRLFLPEEFKDGEGQILIMPLDELKKLKDN
jgi:Ni,Fe-hydrogenase III component G